MNCIVRAGLAAGFSFPKDAAFQSPGEGLTIAGLVIMTVSIGGILTFAILCYRKVLQSGRDDDRG